MNTPSELTLLPPLPGDLGWVIHRQALLYTAEYGWDWRFEGLVAEIIGAFVRDFMPGRERCWIARLDGRIVGSIFLVRGLGSGPEVDTEAKLRMLYVEPDARGHGVGSRLVDECIASARQLGYRRLTLWTNDVLVAARRIYQSRGFVLLSEERHQSFGGEQVGQYWALDL